MEIITNHATAITIDSAQNVGIGTTDPAYVLHTKSSDSINTWLQSTHATDCKLQFSSATTDDYSRISAIAGLLKYEADIAAATGSSGHEWLVDGASKMTLNASGTLTATSADIGVSGANANNYQLRVLAGTTGLSRFIAGDGSDAGYLDYNHNGDTWSIKTAGSERLEINSSGIAVTGTLGVGAGSVSAPSLSFAGDPNTGLYSGAADNIYVAIGGALKGFWSGTQFNVTGNGVFSGSISKGSGSFKIDHPLDSKKDTHNLVHSFIEGPQADLIYRGTVDLSSGSATVNIDTAAAMTAGTFVLLCGDVQCFTTNEDNWDLVKGSVSGNTLTITSQNSSSTATISWLVIGERKDEHMIDTDWTDSQGRVIVEPEKTDSS